MTESSGVILAAVDGSDAALRACRTAASLLPRDLRVQLLVVLSYGLDPYTLLGEETPESAETAAKEIAAVEDAAGGARSVFEEAGFAVEVVHRFGNPADEILAQAEQISPRVIVLGRRGWSMATRWLVGSVTDRVLHHARVPVLAVS
jgi:nucleotide-binding universal stress UspA family protein